MVVRILPVAPAAKRAIVWLGVRDLIPARMATWLLRVLGLREA